jgi:hypothetical protein
MSNKNNQQPQKVAQQPQQKKPVVTVFVGTLHQKRIAPANVNRFIRDANVRISNELRKPVMIVMHNHQTSTVFAQVGNNLIADIVTPAERDLVHHILFEMLA